MIPLRDAPHGARSAVRAAEAIVRRTGMHATYNTLNKSVLIHNRESPDFGPMRIDAYKPDGSERRWTDCDIDKAVQHIQLCRVPKEQKDRWAARAEQNKQYTEKTQREKHMDDVRPGALDYADFLDKKRRGAQKVTVA